MGNTGRDGAKGDFIFDHVGLDSLRNAGVGANASYPSGYGYAFLGGIATETGGFPDVPVDTLGKWADGYQAYGGIPYCEVVRPLEQTRTLYLFDSHINPDLSERPCATVRYPDDGTGTFAYFGFPLYYLQTDPAAEMLGLLLDSIESWQEPAALSSFVWEAAPDSVTLSWYLTAAGGPLGCSLERTAGDGSGGYHALSDSLLRPGANGRYRFVDGSVAASTTYSYRLVVSEQWGVTTTHGPWEIQTPSSRVSPWLEDPRPNPFSEVLRLHYGAPADHGRVSVGVFDVAGRLVRTLHEGAAQTSEYHATWDGTDEHGDAVASGVYFVRVCVGSETLERKVVLLR